MRDTENDDKLIKDFNDLEDINNTNGKCTSRKKILILILIVLIIIIIIIVLYFTVFNKTSGDDNFSPGEIDTIQKEEMDKARNEFKQYKYIDTVNNSYSLEYNLFIPKNYTKEKKYPLIMFIHDASFVEKTDVKSTLTDTVGGPIWATDREQQKHECFVLAPKYNDIVIDDNNGKFLVSEYINVTVRLINKIIDEYSINKDKIYSTGQSMGAMTTLYLLSNYPNLLAAGLVVDGQWRIDELKGLINSTFTYFAAGGDQKAFKGQTEVKEYFNSLHISYGVLTDLNAQDKVEKLNNASKNMYNSNYPNNFITYKSGSVLPSNSKKANEHMCSFKYGYRLDVVRDWIFEQNRVKCEEGYYYSEDGKCANTNYCKVVNQDSSCKECIYGYYLTNDKGSCAKTDNCENGNKKDGECNSCISDYYLDLQEKICKDNTIDEKYKMCKKVDNGICIECELAYYLSDGDHKCSITQNCSLVDNTLCTKCDDGFYLGKDHRCCSVEKCIYSYNGICNECEDGYYFDVNNNICNEDKDNFEHCKRNSQYSPEHCAICKNDFYISNKDYLCYDNTSPGPFYKCEIGNYLGDKCLVCIDGYFIGKIDSKCTKIEGCLESLDENTCLECDNYYCMDNKGNCTDNYYVINEEMKFYFRCKKLNDDGTKCDMCENDLNVTSKGICYDEVHCEVFQDEKCVKCQDDNPYGYYGYCLNEEFGCIDSFLEHCIRCDDILDMDKCTQCEDGYEINEYGYCVEVD